MKKIPDRSLEALRVRDELSHDSDALRALDALAKMSEEESAVEVPPIPDDLRAQWGERYGEARQAVPVAKEGFFASLKERWSGWALGGVAATSLAAIALLFVLNQGGTPSMSGGDAPVMRGGGDFQPTKETVILFIGSAEVSFEEFFETREGGLVLEAADEADVERVIADNGLSEAVVIDAGTGTLRLWKDGFGDEVKLIEGGDAYDLSEALENHLGQ
ncbi:MAG: hypothetical protein ACSHYF_16205 [Verrucomicrobiaceae bacterium]